MLTGLLKLGFQESINLLYGGLIGSFAASSGMWIEGVKNGITLFEILRTKEFWSGLGEALIAAGKGLAAVMFDMVATLMDSLAKLRVPGAEAAGAMARTASDALVDSAKNDGAEAVDLLTPAAEKVATRMGDAAAAALERFQSGFAGAGQIFDTEADRKKLAEELAKLRQDPANRPRLPDFKSGQEQQKKEDDLTGASKSQRQAFGGSIRSTIDMILGRSEQAIMTVELNKQTSLLTKIEQNTKPQGPRNAPPRPLAEQFFT
jgi:hypothetical protein